MKDAKQEGANHHTWHNVFLITIMLEIYIVVIILSTMSSLMI